MQQIYIVSINIHISFELKHFHNYIFVTALEVMGALLVPVVLPFSHFVLPNVKIPTW